MKSRSIVTVSFLRQWTLYNGIFWAFGFSIGLLVGFIFPIIGDSIAVLIFISLVFWFQYKTLIQYNYEDWAKPYVRNSLISFVIGLTISFISVIIITEFSSLRIGHILAVPIALLITTFGQSRILRKHGIKPINWISMNLLAMMLGYLIIYLLNQLIDLHLNLLDVRETDQYIAIIPWFFIGLILGTIYGWFTGTSIVKSKTDIQLN